MSDFFFSVVSDDSMDVNKEDRTSAVQEKTNEKAPYLPVNVDLEVYYDSSLSHYTLLITLQNKFININLEN